MKNLVSFAARSSDRDGCPVVSEPAVSVSETWRLSDLYADDETFRAERDRLKGRLPDLATARGTLSRSGKDLAATLDQIDDAVRRLDRLHAYASLRSDTDTRAEICCCPVPLFLFCSHCVDHFFGFRRDV